MCLLAILVEVLQFSLSLSLSPSFSLPLVPTKGGDDDTLYREGHRFLNMSSRERSISTPNVLYNSPNNNDHSYSTSSEVCNHLP